MYICDLEIKECNTYREPCSRRGGDHTVATVTGTGPGAACPKPSTPAAEPRPRAKRVCKISVVSSGNLVYKATNNNSKIQVC